MLYSCTRQEKHKELQDYTYMVWSTITRPIGGGSYQRFTPAASAFFVRKNNKLFLISAGHTFNVEDSSLTLTEFFIKLYNKNEDIYEPYKIDVSPVSQIKPKTFPKNWADVSLLPVEIPSKYEVNSIERFFYDSVIDYRKVSYVKTYNFSNPNKPYIRNLPKMDSGLLEKDINGLVVWNGGIIDTINYEVVSLNNQFGQGGSGSPIFLFMKNGQIIFGGIGILKDTLSHSIIAIKPAVFRRILAGK